MRRFNPFWFIKFNRGSNSFNLVHAPGESRTFGSTKMIVTKTANDYPRIGPTTPDALQRVLLQSFICFVMVALVIAIAMFVDLGFGERLVPYYGWPVIGFFYASALKAAIPPLFARNPIPIRVCFRSIVRTLLCVAAFGTFTTLLGFYSDNFGNPYLTATRWQPIWTVAVPLGWISVFCISGRSTPADE